MGLIMLSDFNRRTRRHSESETERVNQSKSKTRSVVVVFTVHYSQNFDFKLVLLLQYTHECTCATHNTPLHLASSTQLAPLWASRRTL